MQWGFIINFAYAYFKIYFTIIQHKLNVFCICFWFDLCSAILFITFRYIFMYNFCVIYNRVIQPGVLYLTALETSFCLFVLCYKTVTIWFDIFSRMYFCLMVKSRTHTGQVPLTLGWITLIFSIHSKSVVKWYVDNYLITYILVNILSCVVCFTVKIPHRTTIIILFGTVAYSWETQIEMPNIWMWLIFSTFNAQLQE